MSIRVTPADNKLPHALQEFCDQFIAEKVAVYDTGLSSENVNNSVKIRTRCSVDGASYEVLLQDDSLFQYQSELEESLTEAGFYSASVVPALRQRA